MYQKEKNFEYSNWKEEIFSGHEIIGSLSNHDRQWGKVIVIGFITKKTTPAITALNNMWLVHLQHFDNFMTS